MKHNPVNIPMSIIISGVESDRYFDIVVRQSGMRFVLMSYHYLQKKPKDFLKKRLEEFPDLKVFIDSGAHTFLANSDKFQDKPLKFWEDYLATYTEWVKENHEYIFACANLDLEFLVGNEQVDEWNDKYFLPVEEAGVEVCYIWHTPRGEQGWEQMCKKHSYIGMSMENDKEVTVQRLMKRMKVAQKYNTKVHGMALTKTEILVRVPFFSADSTTWLVGQQYGELNWFNGRKMQRLGKTEWRREYKTKLLKEPFHADWELLINGMGGRGDTYELLRLNVIAYKLAEEYIRKRLKTKMYWMKGGTTAVSSAEKLKRLDLPEYEWYHGDDNDGWEDYLSKLGISPADYTKEEGVNLLYYFFLFLVDEDDHIEELDDEMLIEYAQSISEGESVEDREGAIEFLSEYFKDNATGERTDFVGEEGMYMAKERERYVLDEEFVTVDLSANDIEMNLALPAPSDNSMPEIEAFDEELRRQDIVPVRDQSGRFIKGQKKVRKPKQVYSEKYPKLACDTCYKSGECPQYKAGFVCAYDKMFKRFDSRNLEDIMESMQGMVNFNMTRLQRAMIFETMDGGMVTPEVTGLIDQNMRLMEKMKDLVNNAPKAVVSQKRVIKEDGSEEIVTEMNVSNPNQGGILSKLFGTDDSEKPKKGNVVDADYEVSEE